MANEIELKYPGEVDMDACRSGLCWCYFASGWGEFGGKVLKIIKGKGILFQRLYVGFWENGPEWVEEKENHVWVFDAEGFRRLGVKVGDCVRFDAKVYAYRRKNGTIDFGLKTPENIEKIERYELPSEEQLAQQSLNQLECEVCPITDHCDGIVCLMP